MSETRLDVRGFHVKNDDARARLERIGVTFLTGYGYAAEARTVVEAEHRLDELDREVRGFGYEGAAMAFAVRDGLPIGGSDRVAQFLAGQGRQHAYMIYVGVGWAMARLPRFRWSRLTATDPLLRWLVLDGYGFHQAYFHTRQYVTEHYREAQTPWPADGPRWYAQHAIDQGIGRALWFIGGTDVDQVTTLISGFSAERQPDLFSGTGLAATYAGGADAVELSLLAERAGEHLPQLMQGAVFAATARFEAGLVTPHTEVAIKQLCGITPAEAAQLSLDCRPAGAQDDLPAYEIWRRALAGALTASNRR
jgi:enediyne biosynthesis protein E3